MTFKSSGLAFLLIGLLLGLTLTQLAPAQAEKEKAVQKWEYKTASFDERTMARAMDEYGDQGFELVAVSNSPNGLRVFYFKS